MFFFKREKIVTDPMVIDDNKAALKTRFLDLPKDVHMLIFGYLDHQVKTRKLLLLPYLDV